MRLKELIKLAKKHDACTDALGNLEAYETLEEAMEDEDAPEWAYWLRLHVKNLPEDIKRQAEQKACEDALWALELRVGIKDLQEDVQRQAEQKACEEPQWAYELLREVEDLPEEVKRKAELKVCEDPNWAFWLRTHGSGLHPDTQNKLKEISL